MSDATYRALLIANSTFPSDREHLRDLEGPRTDPALLRDALCDDVFGLFPSDNIRLVVERTMAEVLGELEDFFRTASMQDRLLVYYTGHGVMDQSNDFYLCTRDTKSDRLRSTAVSSTVVSKMIDESAAGSTVILLDCCHSGAFKGGDVTTSLAGGGRFVVTSCRSGELANDAHTQNRASMFTHYLVDGLRGGAPDVDGDGLIGLGALYDYVYGNLVRDGRQVPQKRFSGVGDVPIALRPVHDSEAAPAAVAQPPQLYLSTTEVDLGVVPADEVLPPERIAVVNRGGGALDWTAESSDPWVEVQTDAVGILLTLHPRPGANRANVYVHDRTTGTARTVRVRVRVGEAALAATAEVAAAPEEPGDADVAPTRSDTVDSLGLVAVIASLVGGALTLLYLTTLLQSDNFDTYIDDARYTGVAAPVLAGGVLVGVAILALDRARRALLLPACAALSATIAAGWLPATLPDTSKARAAALVCALAAAICIVALRLGGPSRGRAWADPRLLAVMIGGIAVWTLAHVLTDIDLSADVMSVVSDILLGVVIAAIVIGAATYLPRAPGCAAMLAAATIPAYDIVAQLQAYLRDGSKMRLAAWAVAGVVAYLVTAAWLASGTTWSADPSTRLRSSE